MAHLLDTNVLSELRKRRPHPGLTRWFDTVDQRGLYLSVVTVGEIAKGIAGRRRHGGSDAKRDADALQAWLEGLLAQYADRVLHVNVPIATRWGRLCDAHPQLATDMLIAATAQEHGLTVVTRNVQHFHGAGVPVLNPFEPA